jgi:hypothetical protein
MPMAHNQTGTGQHAVITVSRFCLQGVSPDSDGSWALGERFNLPSTRDLDGPRGQDRFRRTTGTITRKGVLIRGQDTCGDLAGPILQRLGTADLNARPPEPHVTR